MPANSASIILETRYIVNDTDETVWAESEVDSAITDGFGYVTYGSRDEAGASTFDKALAKKYAAAQLISRLVRDKAKFIEWVSSAGESVKADQEALRLESLAEAFMNEIERALKRQNERLKADISLSSTAQGANLNFNPGATAHKQVYAKTTIVGKLNKPKN